MMVEPNKTLIIACAGNYGRSALRYFGLDNIAYFVDNNQDKQGKTLDGKYIFPFSYLLNKAPDHTIIIAANNYTPIACQLESMGINDYSVYTPSFADKIKNIPYPENDEEDIILFGKDVYTSQIYFEVLKKGYKDEHIIFAERKRMLNCVKGGGYDIVNIDLLDATDSTILVSSYIYAYGIEQYRTRNCISAKRWVNPFVDESYYPKNQLVFNDYTYPGTQSTEEKWISDRNIYEAKERLRDYSIELSEDLPLFSHIEIETLNRCNGKCSFCPVSVGHDIRPYSVMEEVLFHKIIEELASLNYSGRIALFSNNEPFIDKRIIDFHKYARERLPKARFHLYTNGSLLTIDKFVSVIKYLDELIIDNYNQQLELNEQSREIFEYIEDHPDLMSKVDIVIRKEDEILNTRGGDSPNRVKMISYDEITCTHPLRQMIIRPDGKVSLCCNDPYGKMTLGDVNEESLQDIWFGSKFEEIRFILQKGRGGLEICRYCDFFGCR